MSALNKDNICADLLFQQPSQRTLAEFLVENEGKRCVVVLDVSFLSSREDCYLTRLQEIDKNEDERTLWSLLAPWELGEW